MKAFEFHRIHDARVHAAAGGQALHIHRYTAPDSAPACFRVEAFQEMAHLFDQDAERLERTARSLGVRAVFVDDRGTPRQHVDLCLGPLRRAKERCAREAAKEAKAAVFPAQMEMFGS